MVTRPQALEAVAVAARSMADYEQDPMSAAIYSRQLVLRRALAALDASGGGMPDAVAELEAVARWANGYNAATIPWREVSERCSARAAELRIEASKPETGGGRG